MKDLQSKKEIPTYDTQKNLELSNEIRLGVSVFSILVNYLGRYSGDVDLYQLLQKYLLIDEARAELNTVL